MPFTKREISNDKAIYQRVIDTVGDIAMAAQNTTHDDPAQVERYRSLLCPESGTKLAVCAKVFASTNGRIREACEAAGCPIYPACYEYVDIVWRCVRALLFLAGQGGYMTRESMEGRCRACSGYKACRGRDGKERAELCIAYLKASADRAKDDILGKLV